MSSSITGRCSRTSACCGCQAWRDEAGLRASAEVLYASRSVPVGASDLPDGVVEFVARQLRVAPADIGSYEWTGRSVERHRAQIRERLSFRECTVVDADQLAAWQAENVAELERRPERVRDELLARCRRERIEPPSEGRPTGSFGRLYASGRRVFRRGLRAGSRGVEAQGSRRSSPWTTSRTPSTTSRLRNVGRMTGSRWPGSRRQRAA